MEPSSTSTNTQTSTWAAPIATDVAPPPSATTGTDRTTASAPNGELTVDEIVVVTPPSRRRRRRWPVVLLVVLLLSGAGTAGAFVAVDRINTAQQRSDLRRDLAGAGRLDEYTSLDAAVVDAKATCDGLRTGDPAEGFERQLIGARIYCRPLTTGYVVVPTPEEQQATYLAALKSAGVDSQFASEAAALSNAERVCRELVGGAEPKGYKRDAVGVETYCPEFTDKYVVIPTPEEQDAAYLAALKDERLSGTFTSDASAVGHAKRVCEQLSAGGKQQGMPEDKVAVQVYCAEFLDGFKVLRTNKIRGSFTLLDDDPSVYFPAIVSYAGVCTGDGGYSDIGAGTQVVVKNASGTVLTTTELGSGSGTIYACTFEFSFTITEGESAYLVEVGRRGSLSYTFSELSTRGVDLSLG